MRETGTKRCEERYGREEGVSWSGGRIAKMDRIFIPVGCSPLIRIIKKHAHRDRPRTVTTPDRDLKPHPIISQIEISPARQSSRPIPGGGSPIHASLG